MQYPLTMMVYLKLLPGILHPEKALGKSEQHLLIRLNYSEPEFHPGKIKTMC